MPSSCFSAFVVIVPKSEPDWGSLRFIVPVHSPDTNFGRKVSFCSWLPWKLIAEIAPALKPGARPNAKFAVLNISNVPPDFKTINANGAGDTTAAYIAAFGIEDLISTIKKACAAGAIVAGTNDQPTIEKIEEISKLVEVNPR